jgi:hypothetical protein
MEEIEEPTINNSDNIGEMMAVEIVAKSSKYVMDEQEDV